MQMRGGIVPLATKLIEVNAFSLSNKDILNIILEII